VTPGPKLVAYDFVYGRSPCVTNQVGSHPEQGHELNVTLECHRRKSFACCYFIHHDILFFLSRLSLF
jgi:hypothetical protein